ncbi:hypothetical protein FB562_1622 [Homoserinimonas aerilata]|uniref:Arginyl-tRNA synthetase n=1 Tax=Homoserinimonas aerilata TaxID=1162970 RepID=A0A542YKB8_9MICO|nr:hypothetical protein FB562_1622 [Homoserinimonas aerilata]
MGAATALALASVMFFTGCAPEDTQPGPSTSATPGSSATPGPSGSAAPDDDTTEPSSSAKPGEPATPVGISCDALISADDIYNYNPNYSLVNGFSPAANSAASKAVAAKGVACGYVNQTSGTTIVVAVATPGADALAAIEKELSSATPVSGFGVKGWFSGGTVQIISGTHWLSVSSPEFVEAADARGLVEPALKHLG